MVDCRHKMANRHASLAYALSLSLILIVSYGGLAQNKERPKLKDFGSSLKRIKWDPEKKAAVEVSLKRDSKNTTDELEVVKVETSLVSNDLLVLDAKGNFVPGLTEKDFVISEDGQPQQVGMFSRGDVIKTPRSIVLIIDSGCSQLPFIKASVAAAQLMIDKLAPADRMAIVTDDIELLSGFTNNKKKLKESLDQLVWWTATHRIVRNGAPFGRGFQYSALMAVLKEAFDAEDERPIIIFQTDGSEARILRNPIFSNAISPDLPPDLRTQAEAQLAIFQNHMKRNPRDFSLDDVYKAAEQSRATIYTVVPGLRFIGLKAEEQPAQMRAYVEREIAGFDLGTARKMWRDYIDRAGDKALRYDANDFAKQQSALAVLSTISGGWIEFFDQPSQADEIYSRILSDINRRYIVGYYSTNKAHDGKRRKVNITVRDHPEYMVMGHRAYYALGPN